MIAEIINSAEILEDKIKELSRKMEQKLREEKMAEKKRPSIYLTGGH
jgi:hypothetical protein